VITGFTRFISGMRPNPPNILAALRGAHEAASGARLAVDAGLASPCTITSQRLRHHWKAHN